MHSLRSAQSSTLVWSYLHSLPFMGTAFVASLRARSGIRVRCPQERVAKALERRAGMHLRHVPSIPLTWCKPIVEQRPRPIPGQAIPRSAQLHPRPPSRFPDGIQRFKSMQAWSVVRPS